MSSDDKTGGPCENTDRELWREREGDYYADSIHVTEGGGIGINCGGMVYDRPLREWHRLASRSAERDTVIEECAKVAQFCYSVGSNLAVCDGVAKAIRALKGAPASSVAAPVAWRLVDVRGVTCGWVEIYPFDPSNGGYDKKRSAADRMNPQDAPHRWQPLYVVASATRLGETNGLHDGLRDEPGASGVARYQGKETAERTTKERHTGYEPDCADCPTPTECKAANRCAMMQSARTEGRSA